MEYTKGEWVVTRDKKRGFIAVRSVDDSPVCYIYSIIPNAEANAKLIASAPLGDELAEFVIKASATWIGEGLLEIGEGDYLKMKELALKFKAKAEGRNV